jgi:hypothetical protein
MTRTTTDFELELPLAYMEASIPEGMTVSAYRRARPRRPSLGRRLLASLTRSG